MWDELDLLPLLTVVSGPLQGVSFRLRRGRRTIGREDGADIVLEDLKVSRRHATVEVVDGRVMVTDLGSTNGTWINEERITAAVELRDGDRLRVGHVQLRFFDPSSAATEPIGTPVFQLAPRGPGLAAVRAARASGALAGPTQEMDTSRGAARVTLTICACAAAAGAMALVYQILQ